MIKFDGCVLIKEPETIKKILELLEIYHENRRIKYSEGREIVEEKGVKALKDLIELLKEHETTECDVDAFEAIESHTYDFWEFINSLEKDIKWYLKEPYWK